MAGQIHIDKLEQAAQREIEAGLTACQLAVARDGEIAWKRSFGTADEETRFWVASATKPIVSSAILILIGDGQLDITRPVAEYAPEFAANGKQDVSVEQVLLMTCGFPGAPMSSADGADPARRIAQLAAWELEYPPGTRYVYHGMSAHWVLAELIERISGQDFRDFVEERVTRPLGLPRLLGIAREDQTHIAQLSTAAASGETTADHFAAKIAAGEPGGGGVMTADTLALFYQGLLHNPGPLWDPEVLADAVGHIRCTLPDPLMNLPANRTLAVVIGAGFGSTWDRSSTAFGWPGAGGQIGFAEPATGISFAFLQMGDTDQAQQFVRGRAMSHLALELGL
ncbi:MAG: serine hydrolase domain-containing protein [Myxococcota bacterium]